MTERATQPETMVSTLGALDVFGRVEVTLEEGTVIEGRAHPITYAPKDRLRLEVRPRLGDVRYELRAAFTDGAWTTPVARRLGPADDDWTTLGPLAAVETKSEEGRDPAGPAWPLE